MRTIISKDVGIMIDFEALSTDKVRIWSSIFWVLGAIFSLVVAIRSYQKDLQPS